MGLSNRKEDELRRMPKLEFYVYKSKDGKYIIHKTTVTDIKPIKYYEAVLTSTAKAAEDGVDYNQDEEGETITS